MYELVEHGAEIDVGGRKMFAVRSKGEIFRSCRRKTEAAERLMDQVTPQPFSAEDFRARVAAQQQAHEGDDYGDHRFNPGHPRLKQLKALRNAAVLIPVVDHGGDATVLLTKRAESCAAIPAGGLSRRHDRPDRSDAGGGGTA